MTFGKNGIMNLVCSWKHYFEVKHVTRTKANLDKHYWDSTLHHQFQFTRSASIAKSSRRTITWISSFDFIEKVISKMDAPSTRN